MFTSPQKLPHFTPILRVRDIQVILGGPWCRTVNGIGLLISKKRRREKGKKKKRVKEKEWNKGEEKDKEEKEQEEAAEAEKEEEVGGSKQHSYLV